MSPIWAEGSLKRSSESELEVETFVSSWGYWVARVLEFLFEGVARRLKEKSVEILSRVMVLEVGS